MDIDFFVPGIPATAGSKTGFYNPKIKRVIMAPANKRQKPWMSHVQACAMKNYSGTPTTGPVKLRLLFHMPRPKNHYGTGKNAGRLKPTAPNKHTKRPDLTKMLRAVEDALTGIIWKDDSQVHAFQCEKRYTDETPGVGIRIEGLEHAEKPKRKNIFG